MTQIKPMLPVKMFKGSAGGKCLFDVGKIARSALWITLWTL
jgi:hypothetical protein